MDNAWIADRLEAFATLLDLADANPYTPRAYRRAAETIRGAAVPVAGLVQSGRVRDLRGIGPGIEARLQELVQTGEIAELAELERELSPELVGLGRYLGLSATRSLEIARALGVRTAGELREAAAAGRLRTVPGIGPKREAHLLDALAREGEPRPQRGLLLNHARELVGGVAAALGGEAAGDVRRWRDSCEHLAVVCATPDPTAVLARFAALPQVVAVVEQAERRAVGVTVEGVPIELVAAEPRGSGPPSCGRRARRRTWRRSSRCRTRPTRPAVYAALGLPWCPPELREHAFRGEPPATLLSQADVRGDLHCHTTWSDGRASVEEMGRAARERGYDYVAICDHTPAVGAVRGLDADDVRRQAEEIAAANEALAPFRVLRGIECDILSDGRLDLPDDVLAQLDWVQASVHGGQRMPRREMTARVEAALRNPHVRCLSHPDGPHHRPAAGERAGPRAGVRGRARDRRRDRGQRARTAARPQRRARPRRDPRRRADRLLHRCALRPRPGEHGARGPDRAPRLGDDRRRPQHRPALVDPQKLEACRSARRLPARAPHGHADDVREGHALGALDPRGHRDDAVQRPPVGRPPRGTRDPHDDRPHRAVRADAQHLTLAGRGAALRRGRRGQRPLGEGRRAGHGGRAQGGDHDPLDGPLDCVHASTARPRAVGPRRAR